MQGAWLGSPHQRKCMGTTALHCHLRCHLSTAHATRHAHQSHPSRTVRSRRRANCLALASSARYTPKPSIWQSHLPFLHRLRRRHCGRRKPVRMMACAAAALVPWYPMWMLPRRRGTSLLACRFKHCHMGEAGAADGGGGGGGHASVKARDRGGRERAPTHCAGPRRRQAPTYLGDQRPHLHALVRHATTVRGGRTVHYHLQQRGRTAARGEVWLPRAQAHHPRRTLSGTQQWPRGKASKHSSPAVFALRPSPVQFSGSAPGRSENTVEVRQTCMHTWRYSNMTRPRPTHRSPQACRRRPPATGADPSATRRGGQ